MAGADSRKDRKFSHVQFISIHFLNRLLTRVLSGDPQAGSAFCCSEACQAPDGCAAEQERHPFQMHRWPAERLLLSAPGRPKDEAELINLKRNFQALAEIGENFTEPFDIMNSMGRQTRWACFPLRGLEDSSWPIAYDRC